MAPNCTSDLLYKGALRDASRARLQRLGARAPRRAEDERDADLRNIVLSEHAKADAIPNLEIEANDVRCGHAASVGPVEEDMLFYLESRGIPRDEAERLVVTGFFQEVLDRVHARGVRHGAELAIAGRAGEVRDERRCGCCDVADVPVGEAQRFAVADQQVAVVNLGEDGFRAIDAICSHEQYFLDEGEVDVDESTIECPKHGSLFDLETGKPLALPGDTARRHVRGDAGRRRHPDRSVRTR